MRDADFDPESENADTQTTTDHKRTELQGPFSIRITGIEDRPAEYVNLVHVNFDPAAFQVVFSQFHSPIITSPLDAAEISARGFINARSIARLVMSPTMIQDVINVFQQQLDAFNSGKDVHTIDEIPS